MINNNLNEIFFTQDEKNAIIEALKLDNPWDTKKYTDKALSKRINGIKSKIKKHHLKKKEHKCAYCQTPLTGRDIETDREHILPKIYYKKYIFEDFNLTVSCKTCNMSCKKDRTDFIVNVKDGDHLKLSSNYKFVHPNFDTWKQHLCIFHLEIDGNRILKYFLNKKSKKSEYTYNYFKLREFEIYSFDKSQGASNYSNTLEKLFNEYMPTFHIETT